MSPFHFWADLVSTLELNQLQERGPMLIFGMALWPILQKTLVAIMHSVNSNVTSCPTQHETSSKNKSPSFNDGVTLNEPISNNNVPVQL